MFRSNLLCIGLLLSLLVVDTSCGVKGPPLPPVPATAEQSDAVNSIRPAPSPNAEPSAVPTPEPSAKPRKRKKAQ
ncbi:MAG: hypothetical protein H7222_16620 [Methylotenera sp.]|nr:hypothetical protein [Oligoflexia bacterium]